MEIQATKTGVLQNLAVLDMVEREVLGLLLTERVPLSAVNDLSEEHFSPGLSRQTFVAIKEVARSGQKIDWQDIVERLRKDDPHLNVNVAEWAERFTSNGSWEPNPARFEEQCAFLRQAPIFPSLSSDELLAILGQTIKRDEANKLVTFLCALSAYTEDAQFNVINNAPSSTGKSYIPMEVTALFPPEDVLAVAYCSPTAFFHDVGQFVKERNGYVVDLARRILVFLDQPHTLLLQHLRPLLSHDKKELHLKITDKSQKYGLKTKNVFLKGFPSVIFCTSNLKIDEQEVTRSLLLSPETHQEKIREAIHQKIEREAEARVFYERLEADPKRQLLKERIAEIKAAGITHVNIPLAHIVEERFLQGRAILKPRHMRDIGRVMALIKGWALLNFWHRKRNGLVIEAHETDIAEGFRVWEPVAESQEYNLPPYLYQLFQEVILPPYNKDKGSGLTRQDILQAHYKVYHRFLPEWQLRQQVLPMLETAGLIVQEPDPNDRRRMLIIPVLGNSESDGGGELGVLDDEK